MDQRILANSAIIQDFHYGPSGCADSNQNFHFGTQAASSVHLIASFAAVQSKLISLSWSFSIYRTPPSRPSARAVHRNPAIAAAGLGVEGKLKWTVLSLTHWVLTSGVSSLRSNPHELKGSEAI
jgi:hypothetical protein